MTCTLIQSYNNRHNLHIIVHLKGAIESGLVELQISKELFTVKRDLLMRKDDAINKSMSVTLPVTQLCTTQLGL